MWKTIRYLKDRMWGMLLLSILSAYIIFYVLGLVLAFLQISLVIGTQGAIVIVSILAIGMYIYIKSMKDFGYMSRD